MPPQLQLDQQSLERSSSGSITGRIWFTDDSHAFPEAGWSDLPVVVLAAWLDLLTRLEDGSLQEGQLHFMDGPFSALACSAGDGALRLEYRARSQTQAVSCDDWRLHDALSEATRLAHALLAACHARGWRTADLDALANAARR